MIAKCVFLIVSAFLVSSSSAGLLPLASYAVAPVATSYSAHTVNHAIATPLVAAAPARLVHSAPLLHTAPLVHSAPLVAAASPLAYSAYPYSAYPYSAYPYSAAYLG